MRGFYTIILLALSNAFMTFAWYGHLKFKDVKWSQHLGLVSIILISWGIALFEYILQVPANRLGFREYGGPFSLLQLKVIQEVITLVVFVIFSILFFRHESIRTNHLIGLVLFGSGCLFHFKKMTRPLSVSGYPLSVCLPSGRQTDNV